MSTKTAVIQITIEYDEDMAVPPERWPVEEWQTESVDEMSGVYDAQVTEVKDRTLYAT